MCNYIRGDNHSQKLLQPNLKNLREGDATS
jgi:hypothetical protein